MKTFEEEYKELISWYFFVRTKIEESAKPWGGGLDGEHTDSIRKLTSEYRLKLKTLRGKYNIAG